MTRHQRRSRLGVAATAAAIVAAACTGTSSSTQTTEAPVATAGTTTTTVATPSTTEAAALPEAALWVSDQINGLVVTLDPLSAGVIGEPVAVGSGAESIAFGAGSVWVVGNDEGVVHRIDPSGPELIATIPVGKSTAGITFAEGLVYASNFGSGPEFTGSVVVIDPADDSIVATVAVASGLTGMASGSVYGAAFQSGEVYEITRSEDFLAIPVAVGPGLSELAVADDYIFVTGIQDGSLYRLDRASLEVLDRIALGSAPNFIDYDGRGKVWVTDSFGILWSVDIETLEAVEEAHIPEPTGIDAAEIDGDLWLFVASWRDGVYRLDPDDPETTMTRVFTAPEGAGIYDVAFGNGG